DIAFRSKNLYLPPFFVWRGYVSVNQNSQNDNQPGAGQIPEDSIHPQKRSSTGVLSRKCD
ncbi:TPA: hypothetical protein ACM7I4_004840, partial [Escherichia coli]